MTSPSPFGSQDLMFERALALLPPQLNLALQECGLTDPNILKSYPRMSCKQLGMQPILWKERGVGGEGSLGADTHRLDTSFSSTVSPSSLSLAVEAAQTTPSAGFLLAASAASSASSSTPG